MSGQLEACSHEIARLEAENLRLRALVDAATEFSFRKSGGGIITVVKSPRENTFYILDADGDALPATKRMRKDEAIAKAMALTGTKVGEGEGHGSIEQ